MLRKLKENEITKYIDFAYALALDITKSSYPTFRDGIKTKDDFIRATKYAFLNDKEEILIYEYNDCLLGWIQYYLDEYDNSIVLYTFLCEDQFNTMLKEFLDYINKKYLTINIMMGFPSENEAACKGVVQSGFHLVEQSYNNVLHLKNYNFREYSKYVQILNIEEFNLFKKLHDKIGIDLYWSSERILEKFDKWVIYGYKINEEILGALYCMDEKILLEVFGIDYLDNEFNSKVCNDLFVNFLNDVKKGSQKCVVYFSESMNEVDLLKEFGFVNVGEYNYFKLYQ